MLSKNQVRDIRSLHLKKFREARQRFIAEGAKTVPEIMSQRPELVETIYGSDAFLKKHSSLIDQHKLMALAVNENELRAISLQNNPNQALAVCRQPGEPKGQVADTPSFSFYLDDIRDPGNFGTIIRLCDWFGARQLYCSPDCCELFNPKVIQSSMGAFLRVAVRYLSLDEAITETGSKKIYGAVLDGKNLYGESLSKGLILIGNEANGIAPEHLSKINHPITIPAHSGNGSESLNAAMATAIIAAEFFRQQKR